MTSLNSTENISKSLIRTYAVLDSWFDRHESFLHRANTRNVTAREAIIKILIICHVVAELHENPFMLAEDLETVISNMNPSFVREQRSKLVQSSDTVLRLKLREQLYSMLCNIDTAVLASENDHEHTGYKAARHQSLIDMIQSTILQYDHQTFAHDVLK